MSRRRRFTLQMIYKCLLDLCLASSGTSSLMPQEKKEEEEEAEEEEAEEEEENSLKSLHDHLRLYFNITQTSVLYLTVLDNGGLMTVVSRCSVIVISITHYDLREETHSKTGNII